MATTTSLVGTVTDETGKTVPAARISAVRRGSGDTYATLTNELGYYTVRFIHVGLYNLVVEKPGFQRLEKTGIVVENNQTVRSDVTLAVGSVSQSVIVEARPQVIQTDDATLSEHVTSQDLAQLPLNGRNPLRLATTTPGVIQGLKTTTGYPPGEDFIGAGTREIQNSISLDGISIVNNLITNTSVRPMPEAIQEMEVQTGTYSAQYGAYMGVHLNLVTRSGANSLHGSVVEFIRNEIFDARPYFLRPTATKSPLRQNQFGFELDGPVTIPRLYDGRNRTFFMAAYQGLRQIQHSASLATLMTPQMFEGNFSQGSVAVKDPDTGQPFPDNLIPAPRISPVVQKLRQYYPEPNGPGITNNFSASVRNENDIDQAMSRIDQSIGDKVRLFFRYQGQWQSLRAASANPANTTISPVDSNNFSVGYTHTLTPRLVSDARFGRQYSNASLVNDFYLKQIVGAGAELGIPGFDADVRYDNPGIPDFMVPGFTAFSNIGTNSFLDDKTWQISEQISLTHGAHTIMAGVEFRKLITGQEGGTSSRGVFNFTGQFTGYAPADFVLGLPQSLTTPVAPVRGVVAGWRDGFFVLDNWQVSRKLTLNYGVRYELPTVPYSVNGYHTKLNPQQTLIVPEHPPEPGFKFIYPNHKNWAPRIGFAYRMTGRTVFRGGYGIYYNPNQANSFTLLNLNPPFASPSTYTSLPTTPTLSLANPTPAGFANAAVRPDVITVNWHLPTPYMNQWSFGVQRELWRNSGLELEYLGSRSLHLDRNYYNNTPLPGPGDITTRRPNSLFGQIRTIQNDAIASYQGLSVVLRHRFSRGLQFLAHYTWSHTLDVCSDSNNSGQPMNPYDWRLDYGNANWDIRHRFVANYIYELPSLGTSNRILRTVMGGWIISGITTLQSGRPFNVTIATDTANTSSRGAYRPNLVGRPSANCGGGHLSGCISTEAFSIPPQYTYGTAGRNLLRGPHLFNTDLALSKSFRISERVYFELRAESFNVWNSPQFSNPNAVFGTAAFGSVTSTSINNREIQLAGRLRW
ncbi:MAG TPA: TonB-dependent receptor [Bryobacteraceae bacterium]|nr:TonB-dependent receptor [Bryobacteraceae bacterium]